MPGHTLRDAAYVVKATHFEKLSFWKENDQDPRVKWEHISTGQEHQVGTIKIGRKVWPVTVVVSFAILNGLLVAFYEPTSRFVDHDMVLTWINSESPAYASGKECNADNFHWCIRFCTGRG